MKGSVWSSLPPVDNSSSITTKPIILAMTSMDSASFFRDKSVGADSPLSVSSKPDHRKNSGVDILLELPLLPELLL